MHSYLVLKCNESLAHQLLFAPDAIAYKLQHSGHFIPVSLLGTLVLMISVIALANAKIQLQIAWAVSYVILNIGHWMAAALPRCKFIFLLAPLLLIIILVLARDLRTAISQQTHRNSMFLASLYLYATCSHGHRTFLNGTDGPFNVYSWWYYHFDLLNGQTSFRTFLSGNLDCPMPVPDERLIAHHVTLKP